MTITSLRLTPKPYYNITQPPLVPFDGNGALWDPNVETRLLDPYVAQITWQNTETVLQYGGITSIPDCTDGLVDSCVVWKPYPRTVTGYCDQMPGLDKTIFCDRADLFGNDMLNVFLEAARLAGPMLMSLESFQAQFDPTNRRYITFAGGLAPFGVDGRGANDAAPAIPKSLITMFGNNQFTSARRLAGADIERYPDRHRSSPDANPNRAIVYNRNLLAMPGNGALLMLIFCPIYFGDAFVGATGANLLVSLPNPAVENADLASYPMILTSNGCGLSVDNRTATLLFPEQTYTGILLSVDQWCLWNSTVFGNGGAAALWELVQNAPSGSSAYTSVLIGGKPYGVAYRAIPIASWITLLFYPEEALLFSGNMTLTLDTTHKEVARGKGETANITLTNLSTRNFTLQSTLSLFGPVGLASFNGSEAVTTLIVDTPIASETVVTVNINATGQGAGAYSVLGGICWEEGIERPGIGRKGGRGRHTFSPTTPSVFTRNVPNPLNFPLLRPFPVTASSGDIGEDDNSIGLCYSTTLTGTMYADNPRRRRSAVTDSAFAFIHISLTRFVTVINTVCEVGEIMISGGPTGTSCQICPSGSYSRQVGATSCDPCPDGAICSGGSNVTAEAGYWQVPTTYESPVFLRCPQSEQCCPLGGCSLDAPCQVNFTGYLCGGCDEGRVVAGGRREGVTFCLERMAHRTTIWLGIFTLVAVYAYFHSSATLFWDDLFFYYQTIGLLNTSPSSSAAFSIESQFLFRIDSILGKTQCFLPMAPLVHAASDLVLPCFVFGSCLLLVAGVKLYPHVSQVWKGLPDLIGRYMPTNWKGEDGWLIVKENALLWMLLIWLPLVSVREDAGMGTKGGLRVLTGSPPWADGFAFE
ncbi:hypothetical protein BDK51DRAFT_29589 [Blyttiomyces helicus]|uniref:Tyrosine-protein kinase ephrin type A/B receptor-like domain-containing protein n=1 Tax=Blyttiomyces helicus TaxID=388810 RepID=A0A4P9WL57_9FUNG|nr:hypothetical protein BDK51DRAFT_29589 [Blyttiomyces helicus]|eukprot:RKO93584.1 hypothetical protein BDK51DRAFT_29589 [Blyttiomyces helicus]